MAKKPYYLIKRKDRLTNGKPTFYCRFRTDSGDLLPWRSTGETTKTRAENWAIQRIKRGVLSSSETLTFGRYAESWWTEEHEYVKGRRARGRAVSPGYIDAQRTYLTRHILPHFKSKKLSGITTQDIELWVLQLKEKPSESGKPLSPTTVNHCLTCLKTMFSEAARRGYIPQSPAVSVEQLRETPKEKQILSLDEVKELFREDAIDRVWAGDVRQYTLNLLAASTGLRMGEVQALQVQHVRPDSVLIVQAWTRKHGLKDPKWGSAREIPIPSKTSRYLQSVIDASPYREAEDLVFWGRDRRTPIGHRAILDSLYSAFGRIGIPAAEREKRNVTFHSWRHLFNSICRAKIPDYKLQRLTGHRTQEMTEHYTHVNLSDYHDVRELQEEVMG